MNNHTELPNITSKMELHGAASTEKTSTNTTPSYNIMEEIMANDLISRLNYFYAFCAVLGFASGLLLFNILRLIKEWRWPTMVLVGFSISEFFILLISISSLAYRPHYPTMTQLDCATLSFFFNLAYHFVGLLQILVAIVMMFDENWLHNILIRPLTWVGLTSLVSFLISFILVCLLGIDTPTDVLPCQLDPYWASYSYNLTKLIVGFVLPSFCTLTLLAVGYVMHRQRNTTFMPFSTQGHVFIWTNLVTVTGRLFYNIMLIMRPIGKPSPQQRVLMSSAEFVLFISSCINLILVLLLHQPFWEGVKKVTAALRRCCCSLGRRDVTNTSGNESFPTGTIWL